LEIDYRRLKKRTKFCPGLESFRCEEGYITGYDNGMRQTLYDSIMSPVETLRLQIAEVTSEVARMNCINEKGEKLEFDLSVRFSVPMTFGFNCQELGIYFSLPSGASNVKLLKARLSGVENAKRANFPKLYKALDMVESHRAKLLNIDDPVGKYYIVSQMIGNYSGYSDSSDLIKRKEYIENYDFERKSRKHISDSNYIGFETMKFALKVGDVVGLLLWKTLSNDEKKLYRKLNFFSYKNHKENFQKQMDIYTECLKA